MLQNPDACSQLIAVVIPKSECSSPDDFDYTRIGGDNAYTMCVAGGQHTILAKKKILEQFPNTAVKAISTALVQIFVGLSDVSCAFIYSLIINCLFLFVCSILRANK